MAGPESRDRPVFLKRYARQHLYRLATGTYLTRGDLMTMVKNGEKFLAIDAGTGNDVTLLSYPIIFEH